MKTKIIDQTPNTRTYQIKEWDNTFKIFVEQEYIDLKGILFKTKKVKTEFVRANIYGWGDDLGFISPPMCGDFKSLDAALEQIKIWKRGTTTYEIISDKKYVHNPNKLIKSIEFRDGSIEYF